MGGSRLTGEGRRERQLNFTLQCTEPDRRIRRDSHYTRLEKRGERKREKELMQLLLHVCTSKKQARDPLSI